MVRCEEVSRWAATVSRHLPTLSPAQARVLALWSYGVALTQHAGTTTVAAFVAALMGRREESVRQRLREWTWEAERKRGRARQAVVVAPCFAGLLGWVLAWWPREERRLALALDATTLGERFTVLSLSVVYGGGAVPVAWAVTRARTPGAWQPHWCRLLAAVRGVVPDDWTVLVLADRGLYARWLFRAIQANGAGWHPYLRINTGGFFRVVTSSAQGSEQLGSARAFATAAPAVGAAWAGAVQCFSTPARRLRCTLLACWEPGYRDRWLVLTDLPAESAHVVWYGLRGWIEQGFKDLKRGGWGWHHTKMTDPARAERLWLVLAVATLWTLSVGAQAEARLPSSGFAALPARHVARRSRRRWRAAPPRRLSLFRRGQITCLVAAVQGRVCPLGWFARAPWPNGPNEQTVGEQDRSALPVVT